MGRQLHHSITTLAYFSFEIELIQLDLGQGLFSLLFCLACLGCLPEKQVILLNSLDFILGDSDHIPLPCAVKLVPYLPIFLTANVAAVDVEGVGELALKWNLAIDHIIHTFLAEGARHKHGVLVHLADGLSALNSLPIVTSLVATDLLIFGLS